MTIEIVTVRMSTTPDDQAFLAFLDCTGRDVTLQETPWKWLPPDSGREEPALSLKVEGKAIMLSQGLVRELLPYLECFASAGTLQKEKVVPQSVVSPHTGEEYDPAWGVPARPQPTLRKDTTHEQ